MIYLLIAGRAGNQFFQYAAARRVQRKNSCQLAIDWSLINSVNDPTYIDYLRYFNVGSYCEKSIKNQFPIRWKMIRLADRLRPTKNEYGTLAYDYLVSVLLNFFGIYYFKSDYCTRHFFRSPLKNIIMCGWFESVDYFSDIDEIIRSELTLKQEYDRAKDYSALKNKLRDRESICVSIRRGAFVTDRNLSKTTYVCDKVYFDASISKLLKELDNPLIYICSDDITWCKKTLSYSAEMIFEPEGLEVYEKIDIMRCCRHYVISNSTFSWWAQHLCGYEKKRVIAPKKWRNMKLSSKNIQERGWEYN